MAFFDDDNLQNGQLGGPTATPPAQPGPQVPMPQPAAPMPAPQPPVAPPQAAPLPVPGANAPVRYSPAQAVGAQQALGQQGQDLELKGGAAESEGQDKIAAEEARRAAEIAQTKIDEVNAQKAAEEKWNAAHNKHVDMFNKYAEKAGSLKDPSTQFWEDKGQGAHIGAALAGFVSGAGAGFNHQQDPFIDYLNDRIKGNYEAHRQNIEDLYKASVESGKIADTVENHNKFNQDARLASTKFGELQTDHELKRYAAETNSKVMKVKALQAANTIAGQGVQRGAQLVHDETAQALAQAALQRAKQIEIRAAWTKSYDTNRAKMGDAEASAAATQTVHKLGYNRSELASIDAANNVTTDPKTGELIFPKPAAPQNTSQEPTFDANGNLQEPTRNANGDEIDPKELATKYEADQKRIIKVNGVPTLAKNEESAKKYDIHSNAHSSMVTLLAKAKQAWYAGDRGTYEAVRKNIIELAPEEYGYSRGPSQAQAGENGKDIDEAKGTIAGQLPEWEFDPIGIQKSAALSHQYAPSVPLIGNNSKQGQAKAKLDAFDEFLKTHHQDMINNNLSRPDKKPEAPRDATKDPFGKVISPPGK